MFHLPIYKTLCPLVALVTSLPLEENPRMMAITNGNPRNTTHMQLVTLCTRVRLFVRISKSRITLRIMVSFEALW